MATLGGATIDPICAWPLRILSLILIKPLGCAQDVFYTGYARRDDAAMQRDGL